MQTPSQSDFDSWKQDNVTRAFLSAIAEQVEATVELLSVKAGLDTNEDNFHRGYIQGLRDILATRLDDLQEATE